MATENVELPGVRTTLFASGNRAGFERSLPSGASRRRRRRRGNAPAPPARAAKAGVEPVHGALAKAVSEIEWSRTLDLGGGVVTPGFYDHRDILPLYGLPDRLDGMRVLDIACFDGFGANALSTMIRDAGFGSVVEKTRFRYGPRGAPATKWHAVYEAGA